MRYVVMVMLGTMLLACKAGARDNGPELARANVKKYAFEAYAQWSMRHPGTSCPATLADLAPYAGAASPTDPWGNGYVVLCGDTLPVGAKNLAVLSLGPDGKRDTADDVKSWE
jgi:hypothetical protein